LNALLVSWGRIYPFSGVYGYLETSKTLPNKFKLPSNSKNREERDILGYGGAARKIAVLYILLSIFSESGTKNRTLGLGGGNRRGDESVGVIFSCALDMSNRERMAYRLAISKNHSATSKSIYI
jgi:hypothetical protein